MCGIAGFCDFNKETPNDILKKMTDVLYHRGPDDSGYNLYENIYANIGLGHRRLSIIDLTTHGHQPMTYENLEIVYNGEVYNYKEIRKNLEECGYKFVSDSDTEVVLKAYHHKGIKALDSFNGMFAIVIYDKVNNKLIFARDRAGVKPLYYYSRNNLIMFASEIKSFHKHPCFIKEIEIDSVALFLQYGYIPQPYTIFKNTRKLMAGHYLEVDLKCKNIHEIKYWDVIDLYNMPTLDISENEALAETERILMSAFNYRMVSDVPVGVFLSGGYDSSLLAAILQNQRTDKIKTFTIGFYNEGYDEAPHAKKVAQLLDTDHTEYYCDPNEAIAIIPTLAEIFDEPFADQSAIPTILVSRIAKEKVTVCLSADGGDEIFGGYNKYDTIIRYSKHINKLPKCIKTFIYNATSKIDPNKIPFNNFIYNFNSKYDKFSKSCISNNCIDILKETSKQFTITALKYLFINDFSTPITSFDESCRCDCLHSIMAIDYKTYLAEDILTKVDRSTMSVGLEGREPLLDYRIVEFVSSLPSDMKIRNGDKKWLLKKITHKYLPYELMNRPKMGFSTPLSCWLKGELRGLVDYYLDSDRIKRQNIFVSSEVTKIKNAYYNGKEEYQTKVWYLLIFSMWHDKWMSK